MSDIDRPARVRVISSDTAWPGSPLRRRSDRKPTPKIKDASHSRYPVRRAAAPHRTLTMLVLFGLGCSVGGVLAVLYDLPGILSQ